MTGPERRALTVAGRLYRLILGVSPRDFRSEFGDEATAIFDQMFMERRAESGAGAAWRFALRSFASALTAGLAERWQEPGLDLTDDSHTTPQRWTSMRHDFKYAVRSLSKRPGFAATVVLLLATGIGAATAVFSVVDGVLLRTLPYPEPDRLVYLDNGSHSALDIQDWQREVESIETWGGLWFDRLAITGDDGPPDQIGIANVTLDLFGVLGARSTMGRLFTEDEHVGDPTVAVLSQRIWRDRWGSDPDMLGRDIRVGDRTLTVVGIMTPDFRPPRAIARGDVDVWIPIDLFRPALQDYGHHVLQLAARLAPGATLGQAQVEMRAMNELSAERFPEHRRARDGTIVTTPVLSLREAEVGSVQGTLVMLLGAVGLLLLLACANVANLLLARGADRTREVALRTAIGATRRNVYTQLTSESLLLSLAGGAVGVVFAFLGVKLFSVLEPGLIPRTETVSVDLRVLGFATLISVLTGLLFGIVPALQASRVEANAALKEGSSHSTGSRKRARLQGSLVVSEVALSLVLLTGAGLLFHSFMNLTSVEAGFESSNLVTVELQLDEPYDETTRGQFADELMRRLRAIPQTRAVVAGNTLPFQYASGGNCCWRASTSIAGAAEGGDIPMSMYPVTAGYLSGLEVPLVAGRDIQPGDEDVEPAPAVIGQHAAELLFGDENPLGRTLEFSGGTLATVVGVASDVRQQAFDRDITPNMYLPWESFGRDMPFLNIAIRTDLEEGAVTPAVRAAIWDLDPDLPIPDIVTMEGRMSRSVADERFISFILASFAVVSLLLAAGGVYATFLYSVRQRVREMGIRLALGARKGDVVQLVLRRGFLLTACGIGIGLVAAAGGARVLGTMMFGISPHDPVTYGVVAGVMGLVAVVACLVPALRAGRTDPMETLRTE